MEKYKLKVWQGWENLGHYLDVELDADVVRRLVADIDLNPEEKARAEAFFAGRDPNRQPTVRSLSGGANGELAIKVSSYGLKNGAELGEYFADHHMVREFSDDELGLLCAVTTTALGSLPISSFNLVRWIADSRIFDGFAIREYAEGVLGMEDVPKDKLDRVGWAMAGLKVDELCQAVCDNLDGDDVVSLAQKLTAAMECGSNDRAATRAPVAA